MSDSHDQPTQIHSDRVDPVSLPADVGGKLELKAGQILDDRYLVIDEIGRGGFATVFRVKDMQLERDVALKVLHTEASTAEDTAGFAALLEEARNLAELDHPNIVPVHDVSEYRGNAYLTMPMVEGRNLEDLIDETKGLGWDRFLNLFEQICNAVDHAHTRGVIHADLKPSNVLLQEADRAKVLDFGIARRRQRDTEKSDTVVSGTIGYLAPEVLRGASWTRRSDVFALGVMAYELLTGRMPFPAVRPPQYLGQVHRGADLAPLAKAFGPKVAGVVSDALSPDPETRPSSAGAFFDQLAIAQSKPKGGKLTGVLLVAAAAVATGLIVAHMLKPLTVDMTFSGAIRKSEQEIGPPVDLGAGATLASGDYYFFSDVRVSEPSYVFVASYDSDGQVELLWPPGSSGDAGMYLEPGRDYTLPPDPAPWWHLGDDVGQKAVFVLASENPTPFPMEAVYQAVGPPDGAVDSRVHEAATGGADSLAIAEARSQDRLKAENRIEELLASSFTVVRKYTLDHRPRPKSPAHRLRQVAGELSPPPAAPPIQFEIKQPPQNPTAQPQLPPPPPQGQQPPQQGGQHPWPPPPPRDGQGGHPYPPPPGGQPPPHPPDQDPPRRR